MAENSKDFIGLTFVSFPDTDGNPHTDYEFKFPDGFVSLSDYGITDYKPVRSEATDTGNLIYVLEAPENSNLPGKKRYVTITLKNPENPSPESLEVHFHADCRHKRKQRDRFYYLIPSKNLAEAWEDARQRKNLTGPFRTAREAVASMLEE